MLKLRGGEQLALLDASQFEVDWCACGEHFRNWGDLFEHAQTVHGAVIGWAR